MELLEWLARLVIGAVWVSDGVGMAKSIGKSATRIGRTFSRKSSTVPPDTTSESD